MKKTYLLFIIPVMLFIHGCDGTEAESDVCRYYIQNDIDQGNFESAIDRLSDQKCQETYTNNEHLVDLSSAYLGKSGLPLPVILRALIEDEDAAEEISFESFVGEMSDSASISVLADLKISSSALTDYLDNYNCKSIDNPTSAQESVCLVTGLVNVLKAAMAINTLSGGDVNAWVENKDGDNPEMLRSSCALKYSFEHKNDDDFAIPYDNCPEGVSVDNSESVTFTANDGSEKTYNHLTISYGGESEYFLESTDLGSTIFTNSFCQIDYAVCSNAEVGGCYSCPLSQAKEDLSIQSYLLDALNDGFNSIEGVIKNTATNEDIEEIQETIDDFKEEIKSEGCLAVTEGEDCFTMDDIIDYLNKD